MENTQVYSITSKNTLDYYANNISEITKMMPTQCYYVNSDNGIFIKYPSGADMDHINGADNIRKLKEADITPKLTTKQMEENNICH